MMKTIVLIPQDKHSKRLQEILELLFNPFFAVSPQLQKEFYQKIATKEHDKKRRTTKNEV